MLSGTKARRFFAAVISKVRRAFATQEVRVTQPEGVVLRCSFCNKGQKDVKKLVAGPKVYICNECVDICVDIVAEAEAEQLTGKSLVPAELIAAGDAVTPGQAEAKRMLAAALAEHSMRETSRTVSPILVAGPTGAGKAELVQAMVAVMGLPLALIDVPLLFPGTPVSMKLGFPGHKQEGVMLLNHIEAAALREDDSGETRRVQQLLTAILDGSALRATAAERLYPIDTRRLLFIAVGSFDDLQLEPGEHFGPEAFRRHGYLPELASRFGTFLMFGAVGEEGLKELLTRAGGLIDVCKERFQKNGIQLHFEPAAVVRLARIAERRKTGIRGMRGMMDSLALAVACETPNGSAEVLIDEAFVARVLA